MSDARAADDANGAETVRPLFDGQRLRLARELRGLSQTAVGHHANVSAAAISQFELGDARPSSETLTLLAESLKVPREFFAVRPADTDLGLQPFFRSLRSTSAKDRSRARALTLVVRWLALELERRVRLPELDVPDIPVDRSAEQHEVEDVAAEVRRRWGLEPEPVKHAVRLLERHGVVVTRYAVGTREMDAFSVPFKDRPVVVLGADKDDRARSRFDALHELGHLVMHEAHDRADKQVEQQAHWFAAAFLMPAEAIVDHLPAAFNVQHLVALKGYWGTSMSALLRRARDLGAMDHRSYVSAMKVMSARGWRRREPGDLGPPEAPVLLQRALEFLKKQGTTLEEIVKDARLPINDVRHVLGSSRDPRPEISV